MGALAICHILSLRAYGSRNELMFFRLRVFISGIILSNFDSWIVKICVRFKSLLNFLIRCSYIPLPNSSYDRVITEFIFSVSAWTM